MLKFIVNFAVLAAMISVAGCCPKTESKVNESNAVVDAIMARRSIRHYTDTPVSRDTLEILAKCGINAPNARNLQEWAVRIVDSKDYLEGATEVMKAGMPAIANQGDPKFRNGFRNATAVIFVAAPEDPSGMLDVNVGALCENICVAAQSMGLGSIIMGGPIMFLNNTPEAKPYLDRLNLPEGYRLRICVGVGYPDETPDAKPRDESKVMFVD